MILMQTIKHLRRNNIVQRHQFPDVYIPVHEPITSYYAVKKLLQYRLPSSFSREQTFFYKMTIPVVPILGHYTTGNTTDLQTVHFAFYHTVNERIKLSVQELVRRGNIHTKTTIRNFCTQYIWCGQFQEIWPYFWKLDIAFIISSLHYWGYYHLKLLPPITPLVGQHSD